MQRQRRKGAKIQRVRIEQHGNFCVSLRLCAFALNSFTFTILLLYLICSFTVCAGLPDLEKKSKSFVLETKRIEIPGHPNAFNPSIIRWRDSILMSFREITFPHQEVSSAGASQIWLVRLNEQFLPISDPQLLVLNLESQQELSSVPQRSEDARLVLSGERLYLVFSDNRELDVSEGGFRMHIASLHDMDTHFAVTGVDPLIYFEGEQKWRREKNWVPFDHQGILLLAYSLQPHRILHPLPGTSVCETWASTFGDINWKWGELRGGTPALLDEEKGDYLAFFHSCQEMASLHSDGETMLHYFMGAYTFAARPPFEIRKISPEPIVGPGFYHGNVYEPYWKPVRVVFPCGFISDSRYVWVSYGRQDHEIWVAKLHKKRLLESLISVKKENIQKESKVGPINFSNLKAIKKRSKKVKKLLRNKNRLSHFRPQSPLHA